MQQDEWLIDARGRVCACALAFAFALLATDGAIAARLVDVRIGTHPGYARVVLETDAPAAHEVVTQPEATPGEVVVRIAATSVARTLPARGGAPEVVIEPQADATTLARIRAAGPVRVETQVLRGPPRLVFDLRAGEPVAESVAAESVVEPVSEPVSAPVSAPVAEPAPEAVPEPAPMPVLPPAEPPVAAVEPEPAPALPPDPVAAVIEPPFEPPPAAEPPAVSSPPALALGLEPRSLVVGTALGIGLALLGLAALRERRVTPVPEQGPVPLPPIEPRPIATEAPAALEAMTPLPAPAPATSDDPELAEDLVRMHRRLDARLAEVAARLDAIAVRQGELDRHDGTQTHEIAAQRVAIARLQRAVPPPPRPRRTGKDPA